MVIKCEMTFEKNIKNGHKECVFLKTVGREWAKAIVKNKGNIYLIYPAVRLSSDPCTCRRPCKTVRQVEEHYDLYNQVCGIPITTTELTDSEATLIDHLAYKTGMDCWFSLRYYGRQLLVRDLEADKDLSIMEGLKDFVQGLGVIGTDISLDNNQIATLRTLLDRFGLLDSVEFADDMH